MGRIQKKTPKVRHGLRQVETTLIGNWVTSSLVILRHDGTFESIQAPHDHILATLMVGSRDSNHVVEGGG